MTVKELQPLQNLIDESSINKLENFFVNTNLSSGEREKLINILTGAIVPIVLKNINQNQNHFDHLG
jgi:hypothetical protein